MESAPGAGSTFEIVLPALWTGRALSRAGIVKPHAPRILLVDDDDAFRHVLAGELQRLGLDVVTRGDRGEAALRRLASAQPDVVLLDLQLPGHGRPRGAGGDPRGEPATEVIMLTGHGSIDTAIESIRMGAFDYVAKPCPLDELEVRIHRALERQSLQRRATLLERGLTPPDPGGSFIGESPAFRRVAAAHRARRRRATRPC